MGPSARCGSSISDTSAPLVSNTRSKPSTSPYGLAG